MLSRHRKFLSSRRVTAFQLKDHEVVPEKVKATSEARTTFPGANAAMRR